MINGAFQISCAEGHYRTPLKHGGRNACQGNGAEEPHQPGRRQDCGPAGTVPRLQGSGAMGSESRRLDGRTAGRSAARESGEDARGDQISTRSRVRKELPDVNPPEFTAPQSKRAHMPCASKSPSAANQITRARDKVRQP